MLKTVKGLFSEEHLTHSLYLTQAARAQKSEKSSQKYKVRGKIKKKTKEDEGKTSLWSELQGFSCST